MAPFVPVPNCAEAIIRGSFRGQLYEQTMWFRTLAPPVASADLTTLATGVFNWWGTNMNGNLSSDLTISSVLTFDRSVQLGYTGEWSGTLTGGAGDAMPNNVALSVSFRTGLAGRSNRGRNYVGAIPRLEVVENDVTGDFATAMVTAYTAALGDNAVATGWVWVVASRKADLSGNGFSRGVTGVVIVDRVVDSQRRRLPGRGA